MKDVGGHAMAEDVADPSIGHSSEAEWLLGRQPMMLRVTTGCRQTKQHEAGNRSLLIIISTGHPLRAATRHTHTQRPVITWQLCSKRRR